MNIVFALTLLIVAFYLLAVLTEEFFVPSIDIIAKRMRLSSDAAGATLLAMGSSAPEFFTSLIAILGLAGAAHTDVGAGTIVGSAIFNVLVIVGVTAMFQSVKLQWKPVMRDQIFYILTILMLLWSFLDGKIVFYEAFAFVALYAIYVFMVTNWQKWFKYEDADLVQIDDAEEKSALSKVAHKSLSFFIPVPTRKPKQYMLTFSLSVIAIAVLSWVAVKQIVSIADFFSINATFLALTVLAAGTSIPDLIGSLVVAKQGRGDMAVSNAIGSNIFDILFGLGVPWLVYFALGRGVITVGTQNLAASIYLLFATVIATLFLLIIRKWHIGRRSGLILVSMYVAYCIYVFMSVK